MSTPNITAEVIDRAIQIVAQKQGLTSHERLYDLRKFVVETVDVIQALDQALTEAEAQP